MSQSIPVALVIFAAVAFVPVSFAETTAPLIQPTAASQPAAKTEPAAATEPLAAKPTTASEPAAVTQPAACEPAKDVVPATPAHALIPSAEMCSASVWDDADLQLIKLLAQLKQQHVIFDKAHCAGAAAHCSMEEAFVDAHIAWETYVHKACIYHTFDLDYFASCATAAKGGVMHYPDAGKMMKICKAHMIGLRMAELRAELLRLADQNSKFSKKKE